MIVGPMIVGPMIVGGIFLNFFMACNTQFLPKTSRSPTKRGRWGSLMGKSDAGMSVVESIKTR